ncbi:MAG: hypothetical protein AB2L20_10135 [Mangrovibacterium sp.]|jgi:hypothetical protein
MLEYAKVILPKICFSKDLFRKELTKCVNWVEEPGEMDELIKWCTAKFGKLYPEILNDVFSTHAA